MPLYKIIAIALITGGTLGLIYGGFSFTKDTHDVWTSQALLDTF